MRISKGAVQFGNPFLAIGFALFLLCWQTSVSRATPLTLAPDGFISSPAAEPYPVGGTLQTQTTQSFSSASLSGTLISSVYINDAGNEYGLSDVTFTYEIILNNSSPDAASAINIGSFNGFNTDVSYNPSNGGVDPFSISRDPDGNQIVFDFNYILPGQYSALLVIQTDATTFNSGTASVTDDVGTPAIPSFAPVPDTTGIGTFIFSLGLLAGFARLTSKMLGVTTSPRTALDRIASPIVIS